MAGFSRTASCQNQDFRDSAGASLGDARLSVFALAGFSVVEGRAGWAKRNPENPANPVNPDSDESSLIRDTLILTFSHEGKRDLSTAIRTWFRVANLAATIWIPAFAGMTGAELLAVGWARRLTAAGRGLGARDTLILTFSHEGRRDLSTAVRAWFRLACPC